MTKTLASHDDSDILSARGSTAYLHMTDLRFEVARQDRRTYYRLLINGRGSGSLTDAKHARETIAHWRDRGWLITS